MAMAALATTPTRGHDVTRADFESMGIWKLRELARESHEEHDPEATRVFVTRILDIEAERRTLYRDDHLQGIIGSAIAPGWAPGGTDIAREPLATLYDRGIYTRKQHEAARDWLAAARLPPRQHLAALIQARKLHGNGDQQGEGKDWVKSYDVIAEHADFYARLLGWERMSVVAGRAFDCLEAPAEEGRRPVRARHTVRAFKNGQAIKDAAKSARVSLINLARQGLI